MTRTHEETDPELLTPMEAGGRLRLDPTTSTRAIREALARFGVPLIWVRPRVWRVSATALRVAIQRASQVRHG